MNRTKVEWVKNPDGSQGYSWNPITGCLDKCGYCYARKLAHGRLKAQYLANSNLASFDEPNHKRHHADPFYPRFWPTRLRELKDEKSSTYGGGSTGAIRQKGMITKGIFVCNMCEFFGDWIPAKWQREIFTVIRNNSQHRFYFLTKQPWNAAKFSPFPDNCWIGVTVCNKQMAFYASMYYFRLVQAKVKYISFEPLLESMTEILTPIGGMIQNADWVIIGSQTKPYNPPKVEWVQDIVEATEKAGKPVFIKDNLKTLLGSNLRQELP